MAIKKKINVYKKIGLLAGLLLLALVGVVYVRNKPMEVAENNIDPTPTVSETKPNIVIEDGVYTNYDYGFRFKYDKDVFVYPVRYDGILAGHLSTEIGNDFTIPLLQVQLPTTGILRDIYLRALESCQQAKLKEIVTYASGTVTKFGDNELGCYYQSINDKIIDGERSWSYSAYFKTKEDIITITLWVASEDQLIKYKPTFGKIFSSFELVETE